MYVHCRIGLPHLIIDFDVLVKFDSLLLNLFLLSKHSNVRNAIFEEVQESYGLTPLKSLKAMVTCWLIHSIACKGELDCCESLVEAIGSMYNRKKEPALLRIRESLIDP